MKTFKDILLTCDGIDLAEAKKSAIKGKLKARVKKEFREYAAEVAVAVADYDGDFDAAANAKKDAKAAFMEEANEENVTVKKVISVVFIEFDSNNPSHAAAYFDVTYLGDKELTWE